MQEVLSNGLFASKEELRLMGKGLKEKVWGRCCGKNRKDQEVQKSEAKAS